MNSCDFKTLFAASWPSIAAVSRLPLFKGSLDAIEEDHTPEEGVRQELTYLFDSCSETLKDCEEKKDPQMLGDLRAYIQNMTDLTDKLLVLKKGEALLNPLQKKDEIFVKRIHAFRQPLYEIMLSISDDIQPLSQELFADLATNLKTIKRHIEELLQSNSNDARPKSGTLDFMEIWSSVEAQIKRTAKKKGIDLRFSCPALRHLRGNVRAICKALVHYASNAIKYSDENSHIDFMIRVMEQNDDHIVLIFGVKDYGKGIALEDQKKLFQPFSQVGAALKTTMRSSGIGLCEVKELAELMNDPHTVCFGVESQTDQEPIMQLLDSEKVGKKGSLFWFTAKL